MLVVGKAVDDLARNVVSRCGAEEQKPGRRALLKVLICRPRAHEALDSACPDLHEKPCVIVATHRRPNVR